MCENSEQPMLGVLLYTRMTMMQITVFGASGKVGTRVVDLALKRGYRVVAFVHKHDRFQGTQNLLVVKGDIRNPRDVEKALKGSKAVISCLSSYRSASRDVLNTAMGVIVPEMKEVNIKRIVTLTGADALAPDEKAHGIHAIFRPVLLLVARRILHDGERHIATLAASNLEWTTLRSPMMNNFGTKGYSLSLQPISPVASVRRQAVAVALVDQLTRRKAIGKAPFILRKGA